MKKSLVLVLVLALAIGFAFSASFAADKVQIKVMPWWLSAFMDYLNQEKAAFEAANPNIEVVYQNVDGDINATLATRLAAGDVPDLVNLNNESAITYYQQGALEPLNQYLTQKDIDVYVPSLWKKTMFDGKNGYTFPWYASPQVMFIQNDVFAKAGLDPVKDAPKTWEDMIKISKIIKKKAGVAGFSIEFANIAWEEPLRCGVDVFSADLKTVAFNDKKFAARLAYFNNAYKLGLIPQSLPDYQTARSMFDNGQLAMYPMGVSMYRWIKADAPKLKFTVAGYPVSPKGVNKLHTSMMNYVIFKNAKNKKEAVEFAKFITGTKAQVDFAKGPASIIPSTTVSVETDPFFAKAAAGTKENAQLLAALTMKNADNLIVTNVPKNVDQIYAVMRDQFLAAIRGEKPVAAALKAAQDQANAMLAAGK